MASYTLSARINVSYNTLVRDRPIHGKPESMTQNAICARLEIRAATPRASYIISGFRVMHTDTFVAYPLFNRHGHKRYEIDKAQYIELVKNATIVIDPFCHAPANFAAIVESLADVIRQDEINVIFPEKD